MSSIATSVPRLSLPTAVTAVSAPAARKTPLVVTGRSVRALAAKFEGGSVPKPEAKGFWTGAPGAVEASPARKRLFDYGPRAVIDIKKADDKTFDAHMAFHAQLAARLGRAAPKVDRLDTTDLKSPEASTLIAFKGDSTKVDLSTDAKSLPSSNVETLSCSDMVGQPIKGINAEVLPELVVTQSDSPVTTPPRPPKSPKRVTFSDTPLVKIFVTNAIIDTYASPKVTSPTPKSTRNGSPVELGIKKILPGSTTRSTRLVRKAVAPPTKASPLATKSTNIPISGSRFARQPVTPTTDVKKATPKAKPAQVQNRMSAAKPTQVKNKTPIAKSAARSGITPAKKATFNLSTKVTPAKAIATPRSTRKVAGKENAQGLQSGERPPWKP
ncbi:hypothetical protein HGRIS_003784 [Hohenbuehelia grisea]|uniref:Uncharacterized protein n=1 Tax=Hohenbuehelia grisea TaxID=104357 RepID=A0ABR3JGI0_9AGAR